MIQACGDASLCPAHAEALMVSSLMWKGLTDGLTPSTTDGAALPVLHTHTHTKHTSSRENLVGESAHFTFFLGGIAVEGIHLRCSTS